MKEFTKSTGKSVEPEATLRNGSKPSGTNLSAGGNRQAATDNTTSDGGSNLESLRQGSKPQPEKVVQAKEDTKAQKSGLAWFQRESGDTGKKTKSNDSYSGTGKFVNQ